MGFGAKPHRFPQKEIMNKATVVGAGLACDITDAFLDAEFEGGKHQIRIDMISSFEENDQ